MKFTQNIAPYRVDNHPSILDTLKYLRIVAKQMPLNWLGLIFIMKVFGWRQSKITVIKMNKNKVIGGYWLSTLSTRTLKPDFWRNTKFQMWISSLERRGYKYFCCFVVARFARGLRVGEDVYQWLQAEDKKIYYIPVEEAKQFYLRNGAQEYITAEKYSVYTI